MDELIVKSHWLRRVLRAWMLAALVTLAVMLTHRSDDPSVFNRYSTVVGLLLAGLGLMVLVGVIAEWMLRRQPLWLERINRRLAIWRGRHWFLPLVLVIAAAVLFSVWLFFLGNHLATYGFLRLFIGFSIVLTALALLFGGNPGSVPMRLNMLPPAILAALVIVALVTISYYPALAKTDEAGVFSMARNALETGHVGPAIYRTVYPEDYFAGGLWTWLMAAWLKVVGLGIVPGRLYVLVVSCITLAFTWAAATRLYDKTTAWFAVLIGAFAFISLNHMRYDIHCALFLAIGLFFYSLRQDRWWKHLLTGLAVGLCIDSNPIGYCFGLGFGVIYLGRYIRHIQTQRQWLWPPFWLLAVGGLLAIVIYLRLRSGAAYVGGAGTNSAFSAYLNNTAILLSSRFFLKMIGQYWNAFLTYQPILFGLMIWGIITAYRERTASDYALLVLYATWTAIIIFAYFYFPVFYIVHALPIIIILAARALAQGVPHLLNSRAMPALNHVTFSLIGLWFLAAVANDIVRLPSSSLEDVVATGQHIAAIVPEDAIIVAAEPYYFGMLEHRGFIGGAVESGMVNIREIPIEEVWPSIAPEALVFSSKWSTEPERTPALLAYMEEHQFVMVSCWETESYGHIELWMVEVPTNVSVSSECTQVCNPRTGCSG